MDVSQSKIHEFPDESDTMKSFIEFHESEDASHMGWQYEPPGSAGYIIANYVCEFFSQKSEWLLIGENNGTSAYGVIEHIVTMRTEPSGAYSGTLADYRYYTANGNKTPTAMAIISRNSENSSETHIDWSGDFNANGAGWLRAVGTDAFVQLEAEL